MKTGGVSLSGAFIRQNRLINENKTTEKRTVKNTVDEKVDLSTKLSTITSGDEALELIRGMDFNALRGTEWVSKDSRSQIMQLVQV